MTDTQTRHPALDGVRGLAIALVLIWHYIACQIVEPPFTALGLLRSTLALTWSGVDLFFVLSGFLIVGILVDARDGDGFFKAFYVRRACRILPLYVVMVALFVVNVTFSIYENPVLFQKPLPLVGYATLTQNFFMHERGFGPNFLGVTWSLAIEEQFYLVIPLLVRFLPRRTLALVFVVAIVLAPVFRIVLGNLGAYVLPFARADAILTGGLIALAVRHPPFVDVVRAHAPFLRRVLGALIIGVLPMSFMQASIGDAFNHAWLAALYGLFVLLVVVDEGGRPSFLERRWLRWLGTRSYGIYLFHQPVSAVLHLQDGRINPVFRTPAEFFVTLLAFAVVFFLAELSFRLFESPFVRLGHRLRYDSRSPS